MGGGGRVCATEKKGLKQKPPREKQRVGNECVWGGIMKLAGAPLQVDEALQF